MALVCARLREKAFPVHWFTGTLNGIANAGEEPPHTLIEFEQHVRAGLMQLSDDELQAWLISGRGKVTCAGEALADKQPPPQPGGSVLEELLKRPRLAGAAGYMPQMVLALAVPPRRQTPETLAVGGYADVITHGNLERLLPSQHALDDLEFIRRFTENELLFFKREEPPAHARQEIVVVLDQGVRTWGDVRLVLTAAALALLKRAEARSLPARLAFTSLAESFANPLAESHEGLGQALEASDMTTNPGLALESILEWPSPVPRDIFILTHRFSLAEQDVRVAARRLMKLDRLFALTVNARGESELAQIRQGMPVALRLLSGGIRAVRHTS